MGSLEEYNILRVIGKGSYGEVHLIQHKKEKKQVSGYFKSITESFNVCYAFYSYNHYFDITAHVNLLIYDN